MWCRALPWTKGRRPYIIENYKGFFQREKSQHTQWIRSTLRDPPPWCRQKCLLSLAHSFLIFTEHDIRWSKKLSIPPSHAMIIFYPFSSLEKGIWNMSNNKLLRIVTCRKQKAKESDLENICGRAVVAWYQRVLETIFEWETANGYL